MATDPAFTRARLSLSVITQAVFNETKALDARDWQIFAGLGRYSKTGLTPGGVKDVARAQSLGITTKYMAAVQKAPSATSDGEGGIASFRFFTTEDIPPGQIRYVPAFFLKRRADLVWDDPAELLASEFPYTNVATQLTASVRKKVYGASLSAVKPPEDDPNSGFFDNGSQFYAAAANNGTYDTADSAQPYYQKWLAVDPTAPKDRQFGFDALSDRYLQLNYLPYDLEKGFVHLYLEIGRMMVLVKLMLDDQGKLQHEGIIGQGVPQFGNYFTIVNEYIAAEKAKNNKPKGTATFVYTLEGTDHAPQFTQQQQVSGNLSLNVMEQVVDPQAVVQASRGLAIDAIDKVQQRWTGRDWLREMVRLRFSEQWVWFWKNSYIEMFYQIDRDKLFLDELRTAQKAAVGPLRRTIDDLIKAANADPNLYLVKRGTKYGPDKRVMGSDDSYVYFYNNSTRLVTRIPMFAFWRDQNVSQISQVIYDATKGMIPVIKAIVWTGTFVMAWGVIGTETIVQGFREYVGEYVADRISGAAIQKLITETFKKFKLRLMALLILPVLDLLGKKIFGETTAGRKIFAFLEGFAEGFTEHAFQAIIRRWESVLNFEPASYRAVKLLMRIEGILRWVDEKMSVLKDYLDETVAKALSHRFVEVAVSAGTALIALIDNLYFLDYKQAKGFLELYAEIAEVPVPSQQDWDRWRHRHFLETFKHYKDEIESTGKDVAEAYNDVQGAVQTAMKVVTATEYAVGAVAITNFALAGGLVPLMLLSLKKVATKVGGLARTKPGKIVTVGAGATAAGGFVAALMLDDDFAKDVLEFAGGFGKAAGALGSGAAATADFTWATPERMQRFGQLLGVVVASVVISRTVIKKGDWQKRWTNRKGVATFWGKEQLRQQFTVNPLLPGLKLALFHYVRMIEEVVTDSNVAWAEFEDKVEAILLGENDPTLQGIVEEDKGITLPKLIDIMKLADALLLKWLKQLAGVPGLTAEISNIAEKLKSLTPSQLPPLDELTNDPSEWAREAVMYIILTHLQGGLNLLIHSLQSMLDPINPKDQNPVSVGFVLQTLGFNLQEADALDALDRNFDAAFEA